MGGYTATFNALANVGNAVWPNRGKFGNFVMVGAALVAGAMDVAAERYARKPLPEDTLHRDRAKFWADKATELSAAPPVTVNIINQAGAVAAVPATPPSKYMLEEGNPDIKTDCFSCASAHLAATKAALERARGAVQDGKCGADCRQWLNLAADESAALLSWDWTDERIAQLPEHQQKILAPRKEQVNSLFNDILSSNAQAVEINKAKSLLGESLRFTNAGDGVNHPEVYGRLKRSEEMLSAAERLDIDVFDIDTANKLRSVRQATGSKVDSPEALKATWKGAREVAGRVNDQVFASMDPATLDSLSQRAEGIWSGFKQDRLQAGEVH